MMDASLPRPRFNRGNSSAPEGTLGLTWAEAGVPAGMRVTRARDLWAGKDLQLLGKDGARGVELPLLLSHDTSMLRLELAHE